MRVEAAGEERRARVKVLLAEAIVTAMIDMLMNKMKSLRTKNERYKRRKFSMQTYEVRWTLVASVG